MVVRGGQSNSLQVLGKTILAFELGLLAALEGVRAVVERPGGVMECDSSNGVGDEAKHGRW